MAVIHLVRHGQASFAARHYDKLSELGARQSRVLGEALRQRGIQPDRVVTGSLARHRDTAVPCLAALGVPHIAPEVDDRWNEYDHENLVRAHKPAYRSRAVMLADLARTGSPGRAFQAMFDQALTRWIDGGDGYLESWAAFSARACAALGDLAGTLGPSRTAVVFSSGGPISAVTANLLGATPQVWLNLSRVQVNTGVTKVITGRSGTTLVSFNDHCHLDAELLTYR